MRGTPVKKLKLFLLLITLPALVLVLATYLYRINAPVKQVSAKNVSETLPVNAANPGGENSPHVEYK